MLQIIGALRSNFHPIFLHILLMIMLCVWYFGQGRRRRIISFKEKWNIDKSGEISERIVLTLAQGKADVTRVKNVFVSHLRISQQFFKELTDASREDKADGERACSARNIRWIHTRGFRVRIVKNVRLYRQCSPRPGHPKCNLATFFARLSEIKKKLFTDEFIFLIKNWLVIFQWELM